MVSWTRVSAQVWSCWEGPLCRFVTSELRSPWGPEPLPCCNSQEDARVDFAGVSSDFCDYVSKVF